MARIPQPPALWIGYNLFRLVAVVFMLWCLIAQFISLAEEIKMLNAIGAAQGTSTMLPLVNHATNANSTSGAQSKTSSGSASTSSSAFRMEYSTAYSEFSVTSATTIRRVSTIPPSSEPTGLGTSVSDIAPDPASGTGPSGGIVGAGVGAGPGTASSSDVSDGSDTSGASSGSAPLIGGGESLKKRRSVRWFRKLGSEEARMSDAASCAAHAATMMRRAEGDKEDRSQSEKDDGREQGKDSKGNAQNGTEAEGVISPWRPEVPAFAAISRIMLVALLGILATAQIGIPEVWLHNHLPYIGPQSTPILLGAVQVFVAVETLRVPGQAINLIGGWGVLGIGSFNFLFGAFLWNRARRLPPSPPPPLWFSHAVRLPYWRPLPPFYAPLFRSEPSLEDQEAWIEGEPDEVEDEKTVQNTLSNSQTARADQQPDDYDARLEQHRQPMRTHTNDQRKNPRHTAKSGRQARSGAPGQMAAADMLSDIALGPTSQKSGGTLGGHTLNGSSVHPYPMSTGQASRYDLDPEAHNDVRQGGYPTFTGTGIGQPGRQIPAGTLAIDPMSGNVVGLNIDEEEEEVAVVKLAERISVYEATSGSAAHDTKPRKSQSRKRDKTAIEYQERSSSREKQKAGEAKVPSDRRRREEKPNDLGMAGEERPGTVHSLLPPVNLLRDAGPVPTVPGSRKKPSSATASGRGTQRRTPSIGKQGLTDDGSRRISDPADTAASRPGLIYSNSSSAIRSSYSGLAYDRKTRAGPGHPHLLGSIQDVPRAEASTSSPTHPAIAPKTPLLTPSPTPTPVTSAHVSHAQTATVKSAGRFRFNANAATADEGQSTVAAGSRGKRGTVIGSTFTRPVELDMSDSEDDPPSQGQASTDAGRGRRRPLIPTTYRIKSIAPIHHPPPGPGSLAQHIKAIEQQQEQQKQLLSARQSAESGQIEPVSSRGAEQGADERPPSALKGSQSSLTPPRERPPRHLRFALSPIPGTPVSAAAGSEDGAGVGGVESHSSGSKSKSRSASPFTSGSTNSKHRGDRGDHEQDAANSASLTIPGIGLTLALPAGLVGVISPGSSPMPASAGGKAKRHREGERQKKDKNRAKA